MTFTISIGHYNAIASIFSKLTRVFVSKCRCLQACLNTIGKHGEKIDGIAGRNAQISMKYTTYTTNSSSWGHGTMV